MPWVWRIGQNPIRGHRGPPVLWPGRPMWAEPGGEHPHETGERQQGILAEAPHVSRGSLVPLQPPAYDLTPTHPPTSKASGQTFRHTKAMRERVVVVGGGKDKGRQEDAGNRQEHRHDAAS